MTKNAPQELDRVCQQDGEVLEKFNELLTQTNGSSNPAPDKAIEDARPEESVAIETEQAQVKEGPSAKIIDNKNFSGATVTLHKDGDKHFLLQSSCDLKIPRGTKLASVGSGKPEQKAAEGGAANGILLSFARGDRSWMELVAGVSANEGGDGEDSAKIKKGTLYSATCWL